METSITEQALLFNKLGRLIIDPPPFPLEDFISRIDKRPFLPGRYRRIKKRFDLIKHIKKGGQAK